MRRSISSSRRNSSSLYHTTLGQLHCGDAAQLLQEPPLKRYRNKIQMVFTSPPFPLNRRKKYGNLQGKEYIEWLAGFAVLFKEYLTSDGSIVIELGNAWEAGQPVMSTLSLEALLAFLKRGGLKLCQEFICYNPARLPSPAEWVNVRRIRVKDAFTRVWWMSPSGNPKANNRNVLTGYSESMKKLLERGTYNAGRRPSEHHIGQFSFLTDNGGAIPPNVLVPPATEMRDDLTEVLPIANTASADAYQAYCRDRGMEGHPARMPHRLVEFFIRFLTDPKDVVLDPFAGSNSTGFVAEQLRRRWIAIETDPFYARASAERFRGTAVLRADRTVRHQEPALPVG